MIADLLPATVTAVATRVELDTPLFEEESTAVARAVETRRREFVSGRACARLALARVGLAAAAVPSATDGRPLWPDGIVGSITHCERYRACAVARASQVRSVGIDAEVHAPLPAGILEAVAGPSERQALAGHGGAAHWDRLLFSAKEAIFKAAFPLTGRRLEFEDFELQIDPRAGTFEGRLLVEDTRLVRGEPAVLRGRWGVAEGIVATAVVVAW